MAGKIVSFGIGHVPKPLRQEVAKPLENRQSGFALVANKVKISQNPFSPEVRSLAGQRVLLLPETKEEVRQGDKLFGHRVGVLPLNSNIKNIKANSQPITLMTTFLMPLDPVAEIILGKKIQKDED